MNPKSQGDEPIEMKDEAPDEKTHRFMGFLFRPMGDMGRLLCLFLFTLISGFLSLPCLCREGMIISKYSSILLAIFFIRLSVSYLNQKLTLGLYLFYQIVFICFNFWAYSLH